MLVNPWVYFSKHPFGLYDEDESNVEVTAIAVCAVDDVIAIATKNGRISFFNSDGDRADQRTDIASKESYYCHLVWKPFSETQLVGGRADGQVISWVKDNTDSQRSYNINKNDDVHRNTIQFLDWNNSKATEMERLFSVDSANVCSIWKIDENELMPVFQIDSGVTVSSVAFLPDRFCLNRVSSFLLGSVDGEIYIFDQNGKRQNVHSNSKNQDAIDYILCNDDFSSVVVITRLLFMFELNFERDGSTVAHTTTRLSFDSNEGNESILEDATLTKNGKVVLLTGKGDVKCWNLKIDDQANALESIYVTHGDKDKALSLAYAADYDLLIAGTQDFKCIFWKECPNSSDWMKVFCCDLSGFCPADTIHIGKTLLIQSSGNMLSLKQDWMQSVYKDGKAALQIDQGTVVLFRDFQEKPLAILETFMDIEGLDINSSYVCVWNNQDIQVYSVENGKCEIFSEISLRLKTLSIAGESLYIAQGRSLLVTDLKGAQRLTIRLSEDEGIPQYLHSSCSSRLTICTDTGVIKIFDITKKEPQLLHSHHDIFAKLELPTKSNLSFKINADSTLLSIMSICPHDQSQRRLHFFHTERGTLTSIDRLVSSQQAVMSHHWDPAEPKVFMCEIRSKETMSPRVLTLFVGNDLSIFTQGNMELKSWTSVAVGLAIPFQTTLHRNVKYPLEIRNPDTYLYSCDELGGFEGCTHKNSEFISAMTDFSFYIASDEIDKAFICATPLKDEEVWKRLAMACIRRKDIDIAKQCLRRMGNENGVEAVQDAEQNPETEVALAEVAIQLGMTKEAERLYRECSRPDLLCNLFRKQNLWSEAFNVAKGNLLLEKSLHYFHAKAKEEIGGLPNSIDQYEKSSLSKRSLLKKMIQHGMPVESFLKRNEKNELISQYASYIESLGDISRAKALYSTADDTLQLVRLSCAEGNLEDAFDLIKGGSKVGAYHLARHLEAEGDLSGALVCYSMSGMYNYGIRLCKANSGFDDELMNFAMKSQPSQILSCAHYFLEKDQPERAARLFATGGEMNKAINIVRKIPSGRKGSQMYSEYVSLIEELDIEVSGSTLNECAQFLISTGKTEKALTMMRSKGCPTSILLDFCVEHDILLNDQMSDIILSSGSTENEFKAFAEVCRKQGNHELACRKFSQTGDKIKAIKALLEAGDTKNIISYANECHSDDVYVLAANYLQTLGEDQESSIKKVMVQFYTKAKAYVQLISLLMSWSTYEAEEGDYERARRWLIEAKKYGRKIDAWDSSQESRELENNLTLIQDFVSARENPSSDPERTRGICKRLLEDPNGPVQAGDCYALLVDLEDDSMKVYTYIQEMIASDIRPEDFFEEDFIKSIYKSVNKDWQDSSIEEQSDDSLETSDIVNLDEKEQSVLSSALNREWNPVRELISERGSELSLKFVSSIFSTGPPQSVAVAVMRAKPSIFSEKDSKGKYPLHYLCYYGAPTYTIIFTVQRCRAAMNEKDEDHKTPMDYLATRPWEHCAEDKDEVMENLERSFNAGF